MNLKSDIDTWKNQSIWMCELKILDCHLNANKPRLVISMIKPWILFVLLLKVLGSELTYIIYNVSSDSYLSKKFRSENTDFYSDNLIAKTLKEKCDFSEYSVFLLEIA